MDMVGTRHQAKTVAALRRFARAEPPRERCELCRVALAPAHRHLLGLPSREIVCACDACALRFQDVVEGRFKLIPRAGRALPDFQMEEAQWQQLALPIDLVFFFHHRARDLIVAMYPSPAGATESLLPITTWEEIERANPSLRDLQPDVEALLVNRAGASHGYYVAPIDRCFELVGLIRSHWTGLSGGEEVWGHIEAFFARLEAGHA